MAVIRVGVLDPYNVLCKRVEHVSEWNTRPLYLLLLFNFFNHNANSLKLKLFRPLWAPISLMSRRFTETASLWASLIGLNQVSAMLRRLAHV